MRLFPIESVRGGRSLAHMRISAACEAKAGAYHHGTCTEREIPIASAAAF